MRFPVFLITLVLLFACRGSDDSSVNTPEVLQYLSPSEVVGNTTSPIGTNVAVIRDWTTSQPFVDVFKTARPFTVHSSEGVNYDENGWPTRLNGGQAETYLLTELNRGGDNVIPLGLYTVLYDGKGKINYGGLGKLVGSKPGHDVLYISDLNGTLNITITETDPTDYIRNIRVLMPGGICLSDRFHHAASEDDCPDGDYRSYEEYHEEILFNPDYLRYMQSFKVLRFMDFMNTNDSSITEWSDITSFSGATWSGYEADKGGAPIEVMVKLANQLNADAWFCMPHKANDEYIRNFADSVKEHLKPELKAYVEYSNEVWNSIFTQSDYADEQGKFRNLDGDSYKAQMKYYSRRSVQIFNIWENSFGGRERLVRVMSTHAPNIDASETVLDFEEAYKKTDALAVAPYFGGDPEPFRSVSSVNEIFKILNSRRYPESLPNIEKNIAELGKLTKKYNVDLIAYEGGQHLADWDTSEDEQHPNPLFYRANRDPRMGILYYQYLQSWRKAGGKLFVHYTSPRMWTKVGSWGVMENLNQTPAEAPKYNAILTFIRENPRWW
ncbi:MAG TPA: hypothetical protein EYH06_09275 [Chromatiales bacterium]|nr:hypothetical protein [Chromatiales bacterium]